MHEEYIIISSMGTDICLTRVNGSSCISSEIADEIALNYVCIYCVPVDAHTGEHQIN